VIISSTYVCPLRGLSFLLPPEPDTLGRAAGAAKTLGIGRLHIPVLEEALLGSARDKIAFLNGLVAALDKVAGQGIGAWLVAPAQRILSLDWVAPHLVRAVKDSGAGSVFVGGKIRNLLPYNWWADPSILQKRIRLFRELVSAVSRHDAIKGWLIMDRALEWPRPETNVADVMVKSCLAEVRERDDTCAVFLSLGCAQLMDPKMAQLLAGQVDGVCLGGLDIPPYSLKRPADAFEEFRLAAFLSTMLRWLFRTKTEIEIGWGCSANGKDRDPEETVEACRLLSRQGPEGVVWLNLVEPDAKLYNYPPWILRPDLRHVGLLDQHMEPKEHVEVWLSEMRKTTTHGQNDDFIDISLEEYLANPDGHIGRLWDHFRDWSCG
jgi:hypothetical protein